MSFSFDKLIKDNRFGYIFEKDRDFFEKNLKQNQWSTGRQRSDKKCFQLGLMPQQIVGDINTAKIFLLNLNPSFSEEDYDDEIKLKPFLEDSLKLDYSSALKDYPFYFLNPQLQDTGGANWWGNGYHFKSYIKSGYSKEILAKRFCCIELIPYHARHLPLSIDKLVDDCPSVENVKKYVDNELIPRAKKKEVLIICLRSKKYWGIEENNDNNIYLSSNVQRASFSLNGKYASVVEELLKKA